MAVVGRASLQIETNEDGMQTSKRSASLLFPSKINMNRMVAFIIFDFDRIISWLVISITLLAYK